MTKVINGAMPPETREAKIARRRRRKKCRLESNEKRRRIEGFEDGGIGVEQGPVRLCPRRVS
jgi:hypothetical protein